MSSFFGFGLHSSSKLPCASVAVLSGWGYGADTVLPFPSFDLVFLFHLVGRLALALVTFFELLVCHCYFSFLSV